jgi:hypothetical protein
VRARRPFGRLCRGFPRGRRRCVPQTREGRPAIHPIGSAIQPDMRDRLDPTGAPFSRASSREAPAYEPRASIHRFGGRTRRGTRVAVPLVMRERASSRRTTSKIATTLALVALATACGRKSEDSDPAPAASTTPPLAASGIAPADLSTPDAAAPMASAAPAAVAVPSPVAVAVPYPVYVPLPAPERRPVLLPERRPVVRGAAREASSPAAATPAGASHARASGQASSSHGRSSRP